MANEGEEDLDDVRSVISSASVSSRQSVASVKAMERRAHLAALKQQIRFAVQESEVRAAQQAAEHKLKQLELAKQVAMAEAELAVYANVEVESDPEVTFPKLRQQPSSPALHQVQQDDVAVKQPIADIQVCNSLVDQSPPEGLLVSSSCNTEVGSHSNVIKYLCESISRFQLPKLELTVFKGDPLEFQEWKMSFVKLVEDVTPEPSHRLHYLMQYTSGEAHTLVTAYSLDPSLSGYNNAMKELSKEFGDPYILARAYLRKIEGWPHIKMGDTTGLRSFLAFLKKCRGSMTTLRHLNQLNTDLYLQKIIVKLPIAVQASWRKRVSCLEEQGVDATFQEVVEFIDKQTRIAKHPVFSTDALLETEGKSKVVVSNKINSVSPKRKAVYVTTTESSSDGDGASSQATVAAQVVAAPRRIVPACPMCTGSHDLDDCQQYLQQTVDDRHKFLVSRKLCFSCYGQSSRNHTARSCRRRRTCATCGKQHPTGLHGYKPAHRQTGDSRPVDTTEAIAVPDSVGTCATHVQSDTVAMSIVMVRVCHEYHEVIVYAALDSMSSACFVTSDVCHQLGIDGEKTEITIKTMSDERRQQTAIVKGLTVVSVSGGEAVPLPKTYVQDVIPVDVSEVPSYDMMMKWPHLKDLVTEMPDRNRNIPVGLLIGANCSKALEPQKVITTTGNAPFAVKTALGWCVSGPMVPDLQTAHSSVLCHRILAQEYRSQVVDTGLKDMMLRMYDHDFNEPKSNASYVSHEDRRFMALLQTESKFINGHYELPLPLRHEDMSMPNNRSQAVQRMKSIKKRFEADGNYKRDYTKFMNDIIQKDYARMVLQTEKSVSAVDGNCWYLPHHGVYHPQKPSKIRVVFDCSSQFAGRSLNQELMPGPNLANSLLSVLIRFRQERIAFLADIEAMFYQVKLADRHTDYVRFVWWPSGDVKADLADYKMTVHLFGATSSPGCANFALRKALQTTTNC